MKAAVCHAFGQPLVVEELTIDPPETGEVKVKIAACAICASDIHYMEGAWGGRPPIVFGHEAAGVVETVGPGVSALAPGDHVVVTLIRACGACFYCADRHDQQCETRFALDETARLHDKEGGAVNHGLKTAAFAEYAVVDQSQAALLPKAMPLDSASLLACGVITGLGAVVNTAQVPAGSSVAVIGTGGVGLNSVQGARLSGADPIVAVDVSADKLEAALGFGATHVIDAAAADARKTLKGLTGGRGADYVFVTVGSVAAIEQGLRMLRRGGALVVVGMPAAGAMAQFEPLELADRGQRILGSKMGRTRIRDDIPKLVEHYQQGRLKLDELITARYPLAEINEAIAAAKRGEALRNVIVF